MPSAHVSEELRTGEGLVTAPYVTTTPSQPGPSSHRADGPTPPALHDTPVNHVQSSADPKAPSKKQKESTSKQQGKKTREAQKVSKIRSKVKKLQIKPTATPADFFTLTPETYYEVAKITNLKFNFDLSGCQPSNIPGEVTAMRPGSTQRCLTSNLFQKNCLLYAPVHELKYLLQFYGVGKHTYKSDIQGCCIIPAKDLC
jgi:hypothetical protein